MGQLCIKWCHGQSEVLLHSKTPAAAGHSSTANQVVVTAATRLSALIMRLKPWEKSLSHKTIALSLG